MTNELEVGKSSQTEMFTFPVNAAAQKKIDDVHEEPIENEDLASYLESLSEVPSQSTRLCGYLNKLGGKGPLKGCKTRWFDFDSRKCHLYYFRNAHDNSPLGSMDLSNAAFNYCLEAEEGTFEIKTPEKDYTLKAKKQRSHDVLVTAIAAETLGT